MARTQTLLPSLKKKARRQKWLPLLLRFLDELRIQSKEVESIDDERGGSKLDLWLSQQMFLETLCDGLEDGIHEFYFLKSRQLGITTIGLAIVLFWLAMHPRIIGCIVADSDENSAGFRETLNKIMESFPEEYTGDDFVLEKSNKHFNSYSNGSRLDFLVAGKSKTNWAESKGYTLAWVSEISKYGKQEGIDSFRETLAQTHPARLFIFESTANGFANAWHDMWIAAGDDPYTKRRRFIGWWAKPANMISRKDPRFQVYGSVGPNGEEAELIRQVETQYQHVVTIEQLAWYRWRQADKSAADGSLEQNQPFTEAQAFVMPGYSFFQLRKIQQIYDDLISNPIPFNGYRFILGTNIFETRMEQIRDQEQLDYVELRVWEEPHADAVYVIGCDPAYGRSEWADLHAISVWRCFADKIVQVAEYATSGTTSEPVETHHCAWVLAYLAGAYRNCVLNPELNGPGKVILRELENCREQMNAEMYSRRVQNLEWDNFLDMARWYLYNRYDSYRSTTAKGFDTTWRSKMELMNQIRDSFSMDMMVIRSVPMLEEMTTIIHSRDDIAPQAPGRHKDDRVYAAALANRAWIDQLRSQLIQEGASYESILANENGEMTWQQSFVKRLVFDFWRSAEERANEQYTPSWLEDRGLV